MNLFEKCSGGYVVFAIDISPLANDFYNELKIVLKKIAPASKGVEVVSKIFYNAIVSHIVKLLNYPPTEIIDKFTNLPKISDLEDIINLLNINETDLINAVYSEYGLKIYLKIKSQMIVNITSRYEPYLIGEDYVVIKEIYSSFIKS